MLGSAKSSENIWTVFDTQTTAATRYPRHLLEIAWTRVKDNDIDFAVVGTSVVNGIDIVQGQLNVLTEPDKFRYYDETERAVQLHYDRKAEEPLGGFTYTIGDVILENTTKRFSWGVSNTIGTSLKPYRPLKMFMGFRVQNQDKLLPTLYGLTDKIKEERSGRSASLGVFDYISYIDEYELESTMYVSQTADQIIADILNTIGFTSSQYSLDTGLNTIGFAWFQKGDKAGERIRKIVEAEEGHFYQDEEGLLRFANRRNYSLNATPVWTINKEDMLNYEEDESVKIINRVRVKAKPREVQAITEIWKNGFVIELAAGQTKEIWADFENPASDITTPTSTIDYTANSASDSSGSDVTSDLDLTIDKLVKNAKLTLENTSISTIYVDFLRLRGTPATIVSEIEEMYEDTSSSENYGRKEVVIENDFIDDTSFAYYLARAIVRRYKDPQRKYRISINAAPQLQVKDVVSVQDMDTNSYSNYRIMRIEGHMTPFNFTQTLTVREINEFEADSPALVDTATVDGPDVVWQ